MTEKKYEFRALTSTDIFPMCRILGKIGIKDIKSCFQNQDMAAVIEGEVNAVTVLGIGIAFDVAELLIQRIPTCETEVFDFLASVSNLKASEIKKMGMAEFAEMIMDFATKPEFGDFMRVVSRFFAPEK